MPKEECVEFVKKSVYHAMYHDGSSGGVCRIGKMVLKDACSSNHATSEAGLTPAAIPSF
jgi:20S proteasome alpha/beta subunit